MEILGLRTLLSTSAEAIWKVLSGSGLQGVQKMCVAID